MDISLVYWLLKFNPLSGMGSDKGRGNTDALITQTQRKELFPPLCMHRLLWGAFVVCAPLHPNNQEEKKKEKNAYRSADYWDPSYTTYHCAGLMCAVVTFSGTL